MSLGHPAGVPAKMPFPVRFSIANNRKLPGHRPVDPCLSRRVSQGHPAGVPGVLLSLCALFFPELSHSRISFLVRRGPLGSLSLLTALDEGGGRNPQVCKESPKASGAPPRGPVAILFISRAILAAIVSQNSFVLVFVLGRDMGGCKTYGGRKTYQRTRSPENFWTPPKELLVCSAVDFCTGKTEH